MNVRSQVFAFALVLPILALAQDGSPTPVSTPAPAPSASPTPNVPLTPAALQANRQLAAAGLPVIPESATAVNAYSWTGLTAGVVVSFTLKPDELKAWLTGIPGDVAEVSTGTPGAVIPALPNTPWFEPGSAGRVWMRSRVVSSAPETVRIYANPDGAVSVYYSWNVKHSVQQP